MTPAVDLEIGGRLGGEPHLEHWRPLDGDPPVLAVLGTAGAGKTSTAMVAAEQLMAVMPVLVLDFASGGWDVMTRRHAGDGSTRWPPALMGSVDELVARTVALSIDDDERGHADELLEAIAEIPAHLRTPLRVAGRAQALGMYGTSRELQRLKAEGQSDAIAPGPAATGDYRLSVLQSSLSNPSARAASLCSLLQARRAHPGPCAVVVDAADGTLTVGAELLDAFLRCLPEQTPAVVTAKRPSGLPARLLDADALLAVMKGVTSWEEAVWDVLAFDEAERQRCPGQIPGDCLLHRPGAPRYPVRLRFIDDVLARRPAAGGA